MNEHTCVSGRRGGSCKACEIEKAQLRKFEQDAKVVRYEGDNFRFVTWGGLDELKLWSK